MNHPQILDLYIQDSIDYDLMAIYEVTFDVPNAIPADYSSQATLKHKTKFIKLAKEELLASGENPHVQSPPHVDDIPPHQEPEVEREVQENVNANVDIPDVIVHKASSTQPEDKDAKIQDLEAKLARLEAQVVGLQGKIDTLKANDDFQLKACKDIAQTLVNQQNIINKQQKEILLNQH
ncbi:hypothetical protein L1987_42498 [Smallanthus sonchifolius]|uniref:Uncharacterized protein n=1 Tax=Smallanthus sonchifolius TaxID=185202 RepID=A0ACB9GL04_9ASTR|nr:hypothetical protein L1987_42498 [Smallanthus sonchifolius]